MKAPTKNNTSLSKKIVEGYRVQKYLGRRQLSELESA